MKPIETASEQIPDIDGARSPRLCPQLLGQEAICRSFSDNFRKQRLHHAWLLSGQKGIGKASFAYQAARFLLHWQTPQNVKQAQAQAQVPVPDPSQLYVPPDSPAAQFINARAHPDLLTITRPWDAKRGLFKESISVEATRQIHGFLSRTAGMGGWRVCIIDCADDLTPAAANALLKIVEEPPDKALFFIVSHQPQRLLATIRSRCQHAPMPSLSDAIVTDLLGRYMEEGAEPADLADIAWLAGGSIGRALEIAEADGLKIYRNMTDLLAQMPDLQGDALHFFAEQVNSRKRGKGDALYMLYISLLSDWLHRLVRLAAGASPFAARDATGNSALAERERKIMQAMLAATPLVQWVEVWEKMADYHRQVLELNLDRKQTILECFALIKATATP